MGEDDGENTLDSERKGVSEPRLCGHVQVLSEGNERRGVIEVEEVIGNTEVLVMQKQRAKIKTEDQDQRLKTKRPNTSVGARERLSDAGLSAA